MVTNIGIGVVGVLWLLSWALLLQPFITGKTGLETLDALDAFMIRQGILLCLFIFAIHPNILTGLVGILALLPKATLRRSMLLLCFSILGLAAAPYVDMLSQFQIH